jgi:ribosomal protein S18 acetylase RimI-like enzyme
MRIDAAPVIADAFTWREARASDAAAVASAIAAWWPEHHIIHGICPQLFEHLGDTCLIVEEDRGLIAFLAGYLSQRFPDAGYVHYMGVHPDRRRNGIGRELYERFAALVTARGRSAVLAETGSWNTGSIAFHRRLGFILEPGGQLIEGLPVHHDIVGLGSDYVRMRLQLPVPLA